MTKFTQCTFFVFLVSLSLNGFSQSLTINTDRPDQSDGVATVPKGHFQVEEGLTLADETYMNNLMLRYGLLKSTEIRLLVDAGKSFGSSGLQPLTLSIKQRIVQENGLFPAVSFVGYIAYGQLASSDFQSDNVPYALKLAFENTLSDKFSLGYNVGTSDEFKNLDLSLGLGYAASDDWSFFAEYFSTLSKRYAPEHNLDAGVLYLIKSDLQVDLAVGHSIFADEDRFYTTFGISYLFN